MDKTLDAFRTIGEVAEELDLPQHVLRFWETKFTQIKPVKRAGGRRYYRPEDVKLVAAIRVLLHSEGYTIKGVQRILRERGIRAIVAASQSGRSPQSAAVIPLRLVPTQPLHARLEGAFNSSLAESLSSGLATTLVSTSSSSARAPQEGLPDLLTPLEADGDATASARAPLCGGSSLSARDRHRMEALLAELDECARLLQEARRR